MVDHYGDEEEEPTFVMFLKKKKEDKLSYHGVGNAQSSRTFIAGLYFVQPFKYIMYQNHLSPNLAFFFFSNAINL